MKQILYISFARPRLPGETTGWLGGAFVEAEGVNSALDRCSKLGINPGGQAVVALYTGKILSEVMDRLLGIQEMKEIFGGVTKFDSSLGVTVCQECNEERCACSSNGTEPPTH